MFQYRSRVITLAIYPIKRISYYKNISLEIGEVVKDVPFPIELMNIKKLTRNHIFQFIHNLFTMEKVTDRKWNIRHWLFLTCIAFIQNRFHVRQYNTESSCKFFLNIFETYTSWSSKITVKALWMSEIVFHSYHHQFQIQE